MADHNIVVPDESEEEAPAVDYANEVLAVFDSIPKEYWRDVLAFVKYYIEFVLREGQQE